MMLLQFKSIALARYDENDLNMIRARWQKGKQVHLQAFLYEPYQFIFEKTFNFFGKLLQLRRVLMRLFGCSCNSDLVICKDSPDYLDLSIKIAVICKKTLKICVWKSILWKFLESTQWK